MSPQLILTLFGIINAIAAFISVGVAIFVAWIVQKSRADSSELKISLIGIIENKLDDYVHRQQFNDYKESHAAEHLNIQEFMVRHRDFKHSLEPKMREWDMRISDIIERLNKKGGVN